MAHERITRLPLANASAWDAVADATEALAAALAEIEVCERLRLVRIDDTHGVLLISFCDEASLEEIGREVIDPWLAERVGPLLSETATTVTGEVAVSLTRIDGDDWSDHDGLADADRVHDFVRRVVETETVWGLYGRTWARVPREDDTEALPFWPHMELAARCIAEHWADFSPRRIALDEFLEQWLAGMDEDGIVAVIAPSPDGTGASVSPSDLVAALRAADT